MIEKDKFGNPIYQSTFRMLKENENVLLDGGYVESKTRPNLFYRKIPEGCFFADMRGTKEVPIWSDTRPAFFLNFNNDVPGWKRRRSVEEEFKRLFVAGCKCRFFFFLYETPEFEEVGLGLDEENGVLDTPNGYCKFCGKDFGGEGEFCSKECEEKRIDELKTPCKACGKKIEFGEEISHHISYFPEKTILVHRSCHTRIHRTEAFSTLRPSKADIEKFYSRGKSKLATIGLENQIELEGE